MDLALAARPRSAEVKVHNPLAWPGLMSTNFTNMLHSTYKYMYTTCSYMYHPISLFPLLFPSCCASQRKWVYRCFSSCASSPFSLLRPQCGLIALSAIDISAERSSNKTKSSPAFYVSLFHRTCMLASHLILPLSCPSVEKLGQISLQYLYPYLLLIFSTTPKITIISPASLLQVHRTTNSKL